MQILVVTLLLFQLILTCCEGATTTLNLEAENGSHNGRTMPRSAASGGYNVWLHQSQYIRHTFTTTAQCSVSIFDVYYSNDGSSDTLEFKINRNYVTSFRSVSHTSYGNFWNVILQSGSLGSPARLDPGTHQLEVRAARADSYGVEIDRVVLQLVCEEPTTPPTTIPPTTIPPTTPPPVTIPPATTPLPTVPTVGSVLTLEAEDGHFSGSKSQRSMASGGLTIWLHRNGYVTNPFTTASQCSVSVLDVAYTNDGGEDTLKVEIDESEMGTFTTTAHTAYGNYWNEVLGSGRIGTPIELMPGSHQVQITVINSDRYGVEIDKISLGLKCERRETDSGHTDATPTRDTPTSSEPTKDDVIPNPKPNIGQENTSSSSLSSATYSMSLLVPTLYAIFFI